MAILNSASCEKRKIELKWLLGLSIRTMIWADPNFIQNPTYASRVQSSMQTQERNQVVSCHIFRTWTWLKTIQNLLWNPGPKRNWWTDSLRSPCTNPICQMNLMVVGCPERQDTNRESDLTQNFQMSRVWVKKLWIWVQATSRNSKTLSSQHFILEISWWWIETRPWHVARVLIPSFTRW